MLKKLFLILFDNERKEHNRKKEAPKGAVLKEGIEYESDIPEDGNPIYLYDITPEGEKID